MSTITRYAWIGVACLAAAGATGCGRNLRSFDQVQNSFDKPTGTVSASTAPTIFSKGLETDMSSSAASLSSNFDTTGSLNFGLTAMGHGLNGAQALMQGCNTDVQLTQGFGPKKISVNCTKNPDVSGSMAIEFDYTGQSITSVFVDFGNWCSGGTCLDGSMGFKFTSSAAAGEPGMTQDFLATARLSVKETSTGKTASIDWAFRDLQSASTSKIEWLVYSNQDGTAKSWVLSASISDGGGDLSVKGANGSFTCHYGAGATSGSCQDSAGNSWTWSTPSS